MQNAAIALTAGSLLGLAYTSLERANLFQNKLDNMQRSLDMNDTIINSLCKRVKKLENPEVVPSLEKSKSYWSSLNFWTNGKKDTD